MSKRDRLFTYLKQHRKITKLEALKRFGIMDCGKDINIFRSNRHNISTEMVTRGGNRFAEYTLNESVGERMMKGKG